jgi:uncharacterized protein (DUF1330 family)
MAGYLIANYQITNEDGYQAYIAAVGATIMAHGGEILVAGPGSEAVEGNPKPVTVVLKFASKDALRGWYDSPEYREIINLRTDNSEGTLVFADGFVMPG